MSIFLYPLYFLAHLTLAVWGWRLWRTRHTPGSWLVALVALGVAYDNLILALGPWLVEQPVFFTLSWLRFALHQLVLPVLIYAAYQLGRAAGHSWAQPGWVRWASLGLTAAVIAAGVATRLLPLQLTLGELDDLPRYLASGVSGPPIVSIVSIASAGLAGLVFWRRQRWPWLALAALLVFIGEGLPIEWVRRLFGSGLEVLFIAAMLRGGQLAGAQPAIHTKS